MSWFRQLDLGITHHVHILEMNADSYRLKQSRFIATKMLRESGQGTRDVSLAPQRPSRSIPFSDHTAELSCRGRNGSDLRRSPVQFFEQRLSFGGFFQQQPCDLPRSRPGKNKRRSALPAGRSWRDIVLKSAAPANKLRNMKELTKGVGRCGRKSANFDFFADSALTSTDHPGESFVLIFGKTPDGGGYRNRTDMRLLSGVFETPASASSANPPISLLDHTTG